MTDNGPAATSLRLRPRAVSSNLAPTSYQGRSSFDCSRPAHTATFIEAEDGLNGICENPGALREAEIYTLTAAVLARRKRLIRLVGAASLAYFILAIALWVFGWVNPEAKWATSSGFTCAVVALAFVLVTVTQHRGMQRYRLGGDIGKNPPPLHRRPRTARP